MTNSNTLKATLALLLAITAARSVSSAHAYALEGQKWPAAKTSFAYVVPGRTAAFSSAVQQALADWTAVTPFKYTPLNRSAAPCNTNAVSGIGFGTTACGQAFGSTTLAMTIVAYSLPNKIFHAGTVFNVRKVFSIYTGPLKASSTDFRRVAVHELGHALGLAHETKPGIKAIMQPLAGSIEKPQPDDIAGVRFLYK